METEAGPPVPRKFPPLPGCVFPLYHVLADAAEMNGAEVLGGANGQPRKVAGLSIQGGGRRMTLIANLDISAQKVRVRGLAAARAHTRFLDETTVERACRSPQEFRGQPGAEPSVRDGELEVELLPYAVARIDWG